MSIYKTCILSLNTWYFEMDIPRNNTVLGWIKTQLHLIQTSNYTLYGTHVMHSCTSVISALYLYGFVVLLHCTCMVLWWCCHQSLLQQHQLYHCYHLYLARHLNISCHYFHAGHSCFGLFRSQHHYTLLVPKSNYIISITRMRLLHHNSGTRITTFVRSGISFIPINPFMFPLARKK